MIVQTIPSEAWDNDAIPLLPAEILNDDWVLYHGTSNLFEKDIEANGFHADRASLITKDVIQQVVNCFKRLNWLGYDTGGYPILSSFTARHDYAFSTGKRIFLGESCRRSLLYATKDFAGGEACRSIRKALKDLYLYLTDDQIRYDALTKRIEDTVNEYGETIYDNMVPLTEDELGWLADELTALQPITQFVDACFDQYRYGIVYALRFTEEDIVHMRDLRSMGITYMSLLKPDHIIAKLLVDQGEKDYGPITDKQRLTNKIAWRNRLLLTRSTNSSVGV